MAEHNELGIKGEQMALDYLLQKGYTLRERNWRFKKAELDLIMEQGDFVVVVEVKTRVNNFAGEPEMAVKKNKQKMLVLGANEYMQSNQIDKEVRFDIVGITLNQQYSNITHIEGAFSPALVKIWAYR
ncbi:MAG: YraN family protein [Flavobacteriales bacterium]